MHRALCCPKPGLRAAGVQSSKEARRPTEPRGPLASRRLLGIESPHLTMELSMAVGAGTPTSLRFLRARIGEPRGEHLAPRTTWYASRAPSRRRFLSQECN